MQFLVTAYDGTDSDAPQRRQAVRAEHIVLGEKLKAQGHLLYAGAILNEEGQMKGSAMFFEFPDQTGLDEWLQQEPYVSGKVWDKIEIQACRVGPMFNQ